MITSLQVRGIPIAKEECFVQESKTLASLTKDLAVKGLWPLLVRMLQMADQMSLKMSSLKLLTALTGNNCMPLQPKQLASFVSLVFHLVKIGNEVNQEILSEALKR